MLSLSLSLIFPLWSFTNHNLFPFLPNPISFSLFFNNGKNWTDDTDLYTRDKTNFAKKKSCLLLSIVKLLFFHQFHSKLCALCFSLYTHKLLFLFPVTVVVMWMVMGFVIFLFFIYLFYLFFLVETNFLEVLICYIWFAATKLSYLIQK